MVPGLALAPEKTGLLLESLFRELKCETRLFFGHDGRQRQEGRGMKALKKIAWRRSRSIGPIVLGADFAFYLCCKKLLIRRLEQVSAVQWRELVYDW